MVDIETLSTRRDAVVIAIAVIKFDQDQMLDGMLLIPNRLNQIHRHQSPSTLKFWEDHMDTYKSLSEMPSKSLYQCYEELVTFIQMKPEDLIWAKSPSFDLVILKDLFEDSALPWQYYQERDVRTAEMFLELAGMEKSKSISPHHPIPDAEAQVKNVQMFLRGW